MQMDQNPTLNRDKIPFYVALPILNQLNKGKHKVLIGNQDRVYVISGREGLGKSTLAMQLAYVLDPTVSVDSIVFSSKQFEDKIRTLDKFKALIYDESFSGLSSKGSISKENKRLVQLLMMCRQRNLFIFIVLPSFFLLEKYVALFRATALFNVLVSKKNFKLRFYKVYNYQKKKELYILGRGLMDYSRPRIAKSHRFYAKIPPTIDIKAYEKKKLASFTERAIEEPEESKYIKQRNQLIIHYYKKYRETQEEIAKTIGKCGFPLTRSQISRILAVRPPKT